jgi:hypothetical protein
MVVRNMKYDVNAHRRYIGQNEKPVNGARCGYAESSANQESSIFKCSAGTSTKATPIPIPG